MRFLLIFLMVVTTILHGRVVTDMAGRKVILY